MYCRSRESAVQNSRENFTSTKAQDTGSAAQCVPCSKFIVPVRSRYMSGCSLGPGVQKSAGSFITYRGIQNSAGGGDRSHQRRFLIVFKLEMFFQREPPPGGCGRVLTIDFQQRFFFNCRARHRVLRILRGKFTAYGRIPCPDGCEQAPAVQIS